MMPKKKSLENNQDKIYFTEATEQAIIRYNESIDMDEREMIYRNEIAKPLDKLAENIINRFKFPYINQTFEDTKRQVVSFLVINLYKYKQDKGKAFSYFSIIAKNYLILHNNNGYREEKRSLSINEHGDEFIPIEEIAASLEAPDVRIHDDNHEFIRLIVDYWDRNLSKVFKKKRDMLVASAVVELFRRADSIENFNKKAIYLLIREMTDCETNFITKVVKKMKEYTEQQWNEYLEHGTIDKHQSEYFKCD